MHNFFVVNPIKEFHHWIWAVELGSTELMKRLGSNRISDECDVSLGGTIDIFGNNFCLVCFHGTSFREAEWATLNVDLFRGQFSTTAMPGWDECNESELVKEICRQSFELQLGQSGSHTSELAAIYHVSAGRGGVPPISHKEIAEWLNYACIHHYIHSDDPLFGFGRQHHFILKHSQKLHIQHIIAIPAFHATVKNDHFWPTLSTLFSDKFTLQENMCTVQCSVSSTFSESIAVTTTVENYLFLHDLFKGYIDHLDKQKISFRKFLILVLPKVHSDLHGYNEMFNALTCSKVFNYKVRELSFYTNALLQLSVKLDMLCKLFSIN